VKRIVSVSIGSRDRDHKTVLSILGEEMQIERIGTDGDIARAIEIIKELDGQVDAFGMGGIDLYMAGAGKRYVFRDARRIAAAAKKTPLVDGTSLKSTLEYRVVKYTEEVEKIPIAGKKVLVVCAIDRIGMGQAFEELGCQMTYGDLIFGLGVPIELHSLAWVKRLGRVLMPIIVQLPFTWLYPTGKKQKQTARRHSKYYKWADVLAGDFHYIKRYMPDRIDGKIVITNTVTSKDVEDLGRRGASILVTTTPEMNGRSFGTNVIEAMLVTLIDKPVPEITEDDYFEMLGRLNVKPRVVRYGSPS
jgi:hypothetical protein